MKSKTTWKTNLERAFPSLALNDSIYRKETVAQMDKLWHGDLPNCQVIHSSKQQQMNELGNHRFKFFWFKILMWHFFFFFFVKFYVLPIHMVDQVHPRIPPIYEKKDDLLRREMYKNRVAFLDKKTEVGVTQAICSCASPRQFARRSSTRGCNQLLGLGNGLSNSNII